jgi:hypothetical protein
MIVNVKHAFISPKADKGDASLLRPSNWNADHTVTTTGSPLNIYNLTGAPADVNLIPGDTAFHTFSAVTSLELHTAIEEGLYELNLICNFDNTLGTSASVTLRPNNIVVSDSSVDLAYVTTTYASNGDNTTAPIGGGSGTSRNAFLLGSDTIVRSHFQLGTFTKAKTLCGHSVRRNSSTAFYNEYLTNTWLNTTTVWSSLGTIIFPYAMTGRVIIRRIF